MNKDIRNADIVTCKLKPASTGATNHSLKVASKEKQKREEII